VFAGNPAAFYGFGIMKKIIEHDTRLEKAAPEGGFNGGGVVTDCAHPFGGKGLSVTFLFEASRAVKKLLIVLAIIAALMVLVSGCFWVMG
jgi:hypothetical protein